MVDTETAILSLIVGAITTLIIVYFAVYLPCTIISRWYQKKRFQRMYPKDSNEKTSGDDV